MSKEMKNLLFGEIFWAIYGLLVLGILLVLGEAIWYSGLVGYNNNIYVPLMTGIGALMLIPGFMGLVTKATKGYFIKEGLV